MAYSFFLMSKVKQAFANYQAMVVTLNLRLVSLS
jgi:hypothetical protein